MLSTENPRTASPIKIPVAYSYNANSQLSKVAQGVITGVLTHDALGRRTQLQRSNGATTTYAYDTASRLAGLTHAKGATVLEQLTYGLDQADNKTQVTQAQQTATALPHAVTAAYDPANQQAQFAGATLAYDSNGNLTNDGTNTYVWDARDRLIGITGDGPPSGTGTVPLSATFSYDALDRRLAKTINGATTTYLYDGADVVTEAGATSASYLGTLNIDEPLVRQTASGNEYYHTDDLGSTVALSDDTGVVTTRYTYGPFGVTAITGSSTNPFQFTGRENDGTGLYYYRARYYNPSHERFLAEDPLEFDGGDANLYAYVRNSPTNYRDPKGLLLERLFSGPLDANSPNAKSANEFVNYVGGQSLNDIIHAEDPYPRGDRSADGPVKDFRYVTDPANPSAIIDMRHFLVVGPQGEIMGLGLEIFQLLAGQSSAFDPQDFYSNALGAQFFKTHDPNKPLGPQLSAFFNTRLSGRKP